MSTIEIISASAGSGKTYRLTELLERGVVDGSVRPHAVLATTFTNKSAAELQERVRVRLLRAGRISDAHRLTAARIGTVNAVCGRLVGDFAFDLGLSPELRVLDEEPAAAALHRSISAVLAPDEETELAELSERMVGFNWQDAVGRVASAARSNGISADGVRASARRSVEEFRQLLGPAAESAEALDVALATALRAFVAAAATSSDPTKATADAVEVARRALHGMTHGVPRAWKDWVALSKLKVAKASAGSAEPVRLAAAAQDRHPRLHQDASRAIELVFTLAARALDRFQQHKRELGVIDFVDQESYALQLLGRPEVREQLAGELDLVLVDEFQDTSPIQLAIFLRLADAATRSVWVGDQKQAIYGFRGADPTLMDAALREILGGEVPETLPRSYRSRPGLVRFTSALFAPAFAGQDIPAARVMLEPARQEEPEGLGPFVECWQLQAKNAGQDAAAVAAATKALLGDPSVRVRDRADGRARPPRAGDVAILCRTNPMCLNVAEQLAAVGIRPVLPRQGLLLTLEGRAALAAIRLWVDGRDTLAAAELARLTAYAGREEEWLATILRRPGEAAFADLPPVRRLREEREQHPDLGVVGTFDAVAEGITLPELCLRWGDSEARLANVEALRSHIVNYANACATGGSGCTPAGAVAYLEGLADREADGQGVDEDDHAVVVSTWHGAKGQEWPIVVLFQLSRRDSDTRALGVSVQTDRPTLELADPLGGRWLRYWPTPYAEANNGTPFHGRLAAHPATEAARRQSEREDLRLLYVGWTRAKDRVVLAGRTGQLAGELLQLLRDGDRVLVSEPNGPVLSWAGQTVDVVIRRAEPLPAIAKTPVLGHGYDATGQREHPPAFVQPSQAAGADLKLADFERIGERIAITGDPDWSRLGSAVHGFFAADRPGLADLERGTLIAELLRRWGVAGVVEARDVLQAAESLRQWVERTWSRPGWYREWPVLYRNADGSVTRGSADLVLDVGVGLVVIDHKSFPGSAQQALVRSAEYAGQLGSYAGAIEAATGRPVIASWIHLPVSGIVVPVPHGRVQVRFDRLHVDHDVGG